MNYIKQKTVNQELRFNGIGIHTGEDSRVVIEPAEPNTGIVFIKLPENIAIKATAANIIENNYSTTIGRNNVKIATIEHLMAAFYGIGIDNAIVYVNGCEIPIMDGSSKFFFNLMEKRIEELNEEKSFARIIKKCIYKMGDRYIEYEPTNQDLIINYEIAYLDYPSLNQKMKYTHSIETFKLIAGSKTFVRKEDMENIVAQGLGKGIIIDENTRLVTRLVKKRINENFVSHKVLDLLGDMYLIGAPLIGKIRCYKGGHILHTDFAKEAQKSHLLHYTTISEIIK